MLLEDDVNLHSPFGDSWRSNPEPCTSWTDVLSLSYRPAFCLFVFIRDLIWPNLALNSLYEEDDLEEDDLGFLTLLPSLLQCWNYRNR